MDHNRLILRRQKEIAEKISLLLKKEGEGSAFSKMTITRVKLSGSMETCKVYYLLLDNENLAKKVLASGKVIWLQGRLGQLLGYKKSPHLEFIFDKGYEHALKIDQILQNLNPNFPLAAATEKPTTPAKPKEVFEEK